MLFMFYLWDYFVRVVVEVDMVDIIVGYYGVECDVNILYGYVVGTGFIFIDIDFYCCWIEV